MRTSTTVPERYIDMIYYGRKIGSETTLLTLAHSFMRRVGYIDISLFDYGMTIGTEMTLLTLAH